MSILEDIATAIEKGKMNEIEGLVQQALDEGVEPQAILNDGMIKAMDEVGEKFSAGKIFVPEMLISARTMSMGTEVLKPHLAASGSEPIGKAVIGTVKGDMHDIGKSLVRMMVEGKGIEVDDLGVDVAPETFVEYLQQHPDCQLVMCSALLTTTRNAIGDTIKAIEEAGLRDQVKIMVGGAPVNQEFCDQVGGDCYTDDAGSAATEAARLLKEMAA